MADIILPDVDVLSSINQTTKMLVEQNGDVYRANIDTYVVRIYGDHTCSHSAYEILELINNGKAVQVINPAGAILNIYATNSDTVSCYEIRPHDLNSDILTFAYIRADKLVTYDTYSRAIGESSSGDSNIAVFNVNNYDRESNQLFNDITTAHNSGKAIFIADQYGVYPMTDYGSSHHASFLASYNSEEDDIPHHWGYFVTPSGVKDNEPTIGGAYNIYIESSNQASANADEITQAAMDGYIPTIEGWAGVTYINSTYDNTAKEYTAAQFHEQYIDVDGSVYISDFFIDDTGKLTYINRYEGTIGGSSGGGSSDNKIFIINATPGDTYDDYILMNIDKTYAEISQALNHNKMLYVNYMNAYIPFINSEINDNDITYLYFQQPLYDGGDFYTPLQDARIVITSDNDAFAYLGIGHENIEYIYTNWEDRTCTHSASEICEIIYGKQKNIWINSGPEYVFSGYIVDDDQNVDYVTFKRIVFEPNGNFIIENLYIYEDKTIDWQQGEGNLYSGGGEGGGLVMPGTGPDSVILNSSNNVSSGYQSLAEGFCTAAENQQAHAEGCYSQAHGSGSHAEGSSYVGGEWVSTRINDDLTLHGTIAAGDAAHAEGAVTFATGIGSHSEGRGTQAHGYASHAEGVNTVAIGEAAHAEGIANGASGRCSHVEGMYSSAEGDYSHAEGVSTAVGETSHSEGNGDALGSCSHAEGGTDEYIDDGYNFGTEDEPYIYYTTTAEGKCSHAEGSYTVAEGDCSHSEGSKNAAIGYASHVEGERNYAVGNYSHAEGNNTLAIGIASHAEGYLVQALGYESHAEGAYSVAEGNSSHAEGWATTASGDYSHAGGFHVIANGNQYAIGHYNNHQQGSGSGYGQSASTLVAGVSSGSTALSPAFIIGNGTSTSAQNAFRVDYNGKAFARTTFGSSGADYAEYFEWADGNPNNEDRRGYFVTLDGEKIRKANENDEYLLGIGSGMPAVIGNNDEEWMGRYILDDFGAFIPEEFEYTEIQRDEKGKAIGVITKIGTKFKENPDYDPNKEYIPREYRPEWNAIGMMGVLSVRDDGTCQVNGYCKPNADGIATAAESGYRVIKRINDHIIKVIFK